MLFHLILSYKNVQ